MNALRKMLKADQLVTAPLVFNPEMAKLAEKLLDVERRTYDKP